MFNAKKLRKLRNNPSAFFKDSKLNFFKKMNGKKIAQQSKTHSKIHQSDNESAASTQTLFQQNGNQAMGMNPISKRFDFEYMVDKLRDYDINAVYTIPIVDGLKPSLAILEPDYEKFVTQFLSFVFHENLTFRYKSDNHTKTPKNIPSFWSDISHKKAVDIRLSTDRVLGREVSFFWFRLEVCEEQNDFVMFPVNNLVSRKLWKHTIDEHQLFQDGIKQYSSILAKPHESEIIFDVDLVFTWVNSDDEDWQQMYHEFKPDAIFENHEAQTDATSTSRFLSRDELKFSLRSWEKYGSFIRNIYIVSNCKAPEWLNTEHPKIKWVDHKDIIPASALPTFSSHAIEACLHKIPGLSNYFIYCNDDILLVRPISAHTFYYHNGIAKLRMEAYGNVNGQVTVGEPDYMNAARNGNKLLEEAFGQTPTQLHTHSPQSMRVDVLAEMNHRFQEDFTRTIHNKFRDIQDISVTSYLYQHYALLSGKALQSDEKTEMVIERHNYKTKFAKLLELSRENNYAALPVSVCINDGADSHLNENWNQEVIQFLNALFPEPSSFENN